MIEFENIKHKQDESLYKNLHKLDFIKKEIEKTDFDFQKENTELFNILYEMIKKYKNQLPILEYKCILNFNDRIDSKKWRPEQTRIQYEDEDGSTYDSYHSHITGDDWTKHDYWRYLNVNHFNKFGFGKSCI